MHTFVEVMGGYVDTLHHCVYSLYCVLEAIWQYGLKRDDCSVGVFFFNILLKQSIYFNGVLY